MSNRTTTLRRPSGPEPGSPREPATADLADNAAAPARPAHAGPRAAKRRWLKPAFVAVLVVASAGYFGRDLLLGTPVATLAVTRGDLVQTLVASGRIATPQRVSIGAEVAGRVASIPVDEGQRVRRGQLLVVLKDDDARAALAQADAAIAQARAKLRQLHEVALPVAEQNLRLARANVDQARSKFDRATALQARAFVTPSDVEDARRNLDVALSQLDAAKVQRDAERADGSNAILAEAALQQALAGRQAAQVRLDATRIAAPADGVLIARDVERGDVVTVGKQLMVLAPDGLTQLVVQVDEKNLSRLALGEKAIGQADAFPDQRFAATVSYINPGIDAQRGAVEARLDVDKPPAWLRQDMTATVDIETARRSNVVIAPSEAIRDPDGASPWVLVVRDGHARRQAVRLGLHGTGSVEVITGVAAGEALVPASNAAVASGRRVRSAAPAAARRP